MVVNIMKNSNGKLIQILLDGNKYIRMACFIIICFIVLGSNQAFAQPNITVPNLQLSIDGASSPEETVNSLQLLSLLTILSLAPAILIMVTSFTRIIIVLSFLRNALATQQTPSTDRIGFVFNLFYHGTCSF